MSDHTRGMTRSDHLLVQMNQNHHFLVLFILLLVMFGIAGGLLMGSWILGL